MVEAVDAEPVDTQHQLRPILYKGLEHPRIVVSAEGCGTNIPQIPRDDRILLHG